MHFHTAMYAPSEIVVLVILKASYHAHTILLHYINVILPIYFVVCTPNAVCCGMVRDEMS